MLLADYPADPQPHGSDPFTDPAGQMLRRVMAQVTQGGRGVAYGYCVRCRPVDRGRLDRARPPSPVEASHCRVNVMKDLALLKPKQVVLLGLGAAKLLAQLPDGSAVSAKVQLGDLRGRDLHCTADDGTKIPVIVTYDPEFIQRNPTVAATSAAVPRYSN